MRIVGVFFSIVLLVSCGTNKEKNIDKESNAYIVNSIEGEKIILDGVLSEVAWEEANSMTGFTLPWENNESQLTEFKALYDNDNFYFSFAVVDTEVVVLDSIDTEEYLVYEDRVEIYFAFDDSLSEPYYCIEVDPKGRFLDYRATFPRQFEFDVDWGSIKAESVLTDYGYVVEASVSLDDMKHLGYKINNDKTILKVAVFRADFEKENSDTLVERWQAWIDPNLDEPDFHVPATFGDFIFSK